MTRSTSSLALPALTLGLALSVPAAARAHEPGTSGVRVEVDGRAARVTYTLAPADLPLLLDRVDQDGDGLLSREEYAQALPRLGRVLGERLRLTAGERPCRAEVVGDVFPAVRALPLAHGLGDAGRVGAVLRYEADAPLEGLRVESAVFADAGHARREVVEFVPGGACVLEGGRGRAEWSAAAERGALAEGLAFVGEGVWHILIGWDHLAFLLALLVVTRGLREVAALVTAFTLAHSVTLGLVALGVYSPPSALVESIIALSIACVALENLCLRERAGSRCVRRRAVAVFAFGLVHGMGFGGVLLDLELTRPLPALVGFNLGVELGQLALVAAVAPLLAALRRWPRLHRRVVVQGTSLALVVTGLVVGALRLFG